MKRIRPQTDDPETGYPSVDEQSRRDFLRCALGTAAVTAGVLSGRDAGARARPAASKLEKVTLNIPYWVHIPGTVYKAEKLDLWTRDRRLAEFLRKRSERPGIAKAAAAPVRKAKAVVLQDGRKLYQLERRIAQAVTKRYRERTKRRAAAPDVMLYLTQRSRRVRVRTGGVMVRPRRPVRLPRRRP